MKSWKKIALAGGLALAMTLTLAGCGAAKSMNNMTESSWGGDGSGLYSEQASQEYDSIGWNGDTAPGDNGGPEDGIPRESKMIYTARLTMETVEFDKTVAGLEGLVTDCGGYVESSSLDGGTYRWGYFTVRIPREKFQDFCDRAGALCQLNSKSVERQNVSEQYYDTESRLTTQRTKLERLQTLLSQATKMEDIITLESAIADTELTIEQLTGTLRNYDSLVDYSTVDITLHEVSQLSGTVAAPIGFGETLAAAFRTGSRNFVYGVQDVLLSFARGWAGWLIFAAVVVLLVLFLKKHGIRRKKKAPKAEKAEKSEEQPQESTKE